MYDPNEQVEQNSVEENQVPLANNFSNGFNATIKDKTENIKQQNLNDLRRNISQGNNKLSHTNINNKNNDSNNVNSIKTRLTSLKGRSSLSNNKMSKSGEISSNSNTTNTSSNSNFFNLGGEKDNKESKDIFSNDKNSNYSNLGESTGNNSDISSGANDFSTSLKKIVKKIISLVTSLASSFFMGLIAFLAPLLLIIILVCVIYDSIIRPIVEFFGSENVTENQVVSMTTEEIQEKLNEAGVTTQFNSYDITEMDYGELQIVFDTYENSENSLMSNFVNKFTSILAEAIVNNDKYQGIDLSTSVARKIFKVSYENKLEEMFGSNIDENDFPVGVQLATFNYLYSSQYMNSDRTYESIFEEIDRETGEIILEELETNRISLNNSNNLIADLLTGKTISVQDVLDLSDNLAFHEFYPSYNVNEVTECKDDSCTVTVKCENNGIDRYYIDYDKYYMFLRYGDEVSGYAYDKNVGDYQKVGTGDTSNLTGKGYEYFKNLKSAYSSSDDVCKTQGNFDEYLDNLKNSLPSNYSVVVDNSVQTALNFFTNSGIVSNDAINLNHEIFDDFSKYLVIASKDSEEIPSVKVNNDYPYDYTDGNEYFYKDGWVFNKFPYYRSDFQEITGDEYVYEDINTPIGIEARINNISSLKDFYNESLGYKVEDNEFSKSYNSDGTEFFPLPVGSYNISSCFGYRFLNGSSNYHKGIDIVVDPNTDVPVYAWKSGTVISLNNNCLESAGLNDTCGGGYGNYVIIDHGIINGERYYSLYGHLDSVNVSINDEITAGTQLGFSGNTGESSAKHLHFEIRTSLSTWTSSEAQDPYNTLLEIVKDEELPNVCTKNTTFNVANETLSSTQSSSANKKELCNLLVNKFSENGAIALMANAAHESSYRTGAIGDGGTSYGLFQWRNDRMDELIENYPNYNTVGAQFNYLIYELQFEYRSLYNNLLSSNKSSKELAYDFCYYFERPKNKEVSCKNRMVSNKYQDAYNYVKNGCQ